MSIDAVTAVGSAASPVVRGTKVAEQLTQATQAASADGLTPQAQLAAVDTRAALQAAARQIDSYLKSVGREVEFRVDEDTDLTVVTVRNTATGEVVRQIPSEEALQLARHLEAGSSALLSLTV